MGRLLTATGIAKAYRKAGGLVPVLRDVAFTLDEGEAVAVIGPSGSGKSTFLNLVGGLDRPDAGEIRFRDTVLRVGDAPLMTRWRNATVGFVFQFHFLLPDFTALENLLIPVHMDHPPTPADHQRAQDLLAALGLSERSDHLPGELSGGEQQRVAVARAFMNRPQIVLADEPFGNLDREKGQQLGDLLFELRRRENVALVIVTHDLSLADRADRVLRLDGGRLLPAEVAS
jgi:lipoprotein-releasing system ATP-binding protein